MPARGAAYGGRQVRTAARRKNHRVEPQGRKRQRRPLRLNAFALLVLRGAQAPRIRGGHAT